jgi:hypothetical protein
LKVVGVLSWYDESAAWLAAAVAGFSRVCDAVVAVDGAYGLYPGARPRSHPEQVEAVRATCETLDKECVIFQPSEPFWGNEVEKRNLTMRLAGALSPDWVMVFDADYHLMRCEPERVRYELEHTDLNVATYTLLDGIDVLADEYRAELAVKMDLSTDWTCRTRDIYRWTPDLRYGPAHFTVRGSYDGRDVWLRGPELVKSGVPVEPCHDLNEALVAVHRTSHRAKVRRESSQEYYRRRDAAGLEVLEDDWAANIEAQENAA